MGGGAAPHLVGPMSDIPQKLGIKSHRAAKVSDDCEAHPRVDVLCLGNDLLRPVQGS